MNLALKLNPHNILKPNANLNYTNSIMHTVQEK